MPRDASETRDRLLSAAERLFATHGIFQATTREITEAAGQRNASALTYHFGSRGGALREILRRHGDPLDDERGRLAPRPTEAHPTRDLVAALLLPYTACTTTVSGRNYLRIVAQLTDQFPIWRVESELTPPNLRRILGALEQRIDGGGPIGQERVVGAIMLMTTAAADRARTIDEGRHPTLDDARFVANLADMIVGALEATVGPLLTPPGAG